MAAWITGVQIGPDYSRIDFRLAGFSAAMCAELEEKVNAVLRGNHVLRSYGTSQRRSSAAAAICAGPWTVAPPVFDGQVRVVEIEGFDAQACGGTHVATTSAVGSVLDLPPREQRQGQQAAVRPPHLTGNGAPPHRDRSRSTGLRAGRPRSARPERAG